MEARKFNRLLKSIAKDENAFDELYQFYGRRIVFHLSGIYGRELAEDVSHDFFLKLITENKNYGYIEKPTSWVYTCCENLAKTKIRLDSKYALLNEEVACKYVEFENLENLEVKTVLDNFDDVTRRIVELFYWDGYNLEEISEILHIKYATVRKKHSRAKAKLKKILK
ncbi:MAG: sigma-70 family RNA polymerase sigma factor [Bacilli bacterium]|nr:sigma-70 family RNA polymerase sigma factor [Bacilli bacterium]